MAWFSLNRADAAPAASATPGPSLLGGRYRLGARIGSGAAADVHQAIDLRTGGKVAIKLIALPDDLPPSQRQDWLTRLQHPNIVAVFEAGLTRHHAWMAMERVHGVDLSRYVQPMRLLPEAIVLHIGARVGSALAHAHANGVVHRDLKPANVLVNLGTDQVKLADFGVARLNDAQLTRTGVTLGTPSYMAPELLAGATANGASDAYALGVMLFELLAGRRPHQGDTLGELLKVIAREPPAALATLRPDLPNPVVTAVEQLLARAPAQRPADLAAWASQISALAALMSRVLALPAAPARPRP